MSETYNELPIATEEQATELHEISDALYYTLVNHTSDPNTGLSAIGLLLVKVLTVATENNDEALDSFRKAGIPLIEGTIANVIRGKDSKSKTLN